MTDIVSVDNLAHRYGDHRALDGVSFNVAAGECFGIMGPNGSGKTTLFRILTTLLTPFAGSAAVDGFDVVTARGEVRRRIGVVFQSPSLDLHLTVRENLRHGGALYGLSGLDLRRRIDEALNTMEVSDRGADLVKTLSGGLRRRVELAKCLLHRPSLLILDEPSTGLDPRVRQDMWKHLQVLQQERGLSILVTTHFISEADRCDRLAIFDRGRLVACETPDDLKRRIGGDCLTIECDKPADLCADISKQLSCRPSEVNGAVRVETENGPTFVAEVMNRFGDQIRTITFGKPTLEDVFVHETGHRFDDNQESGD